MQLDHRHHKEFGNQLRRFRAELAEMKRTIKTLERDSDKVNRMETARLQVESAVKGLQSVMQSIVHEDFGYLTPVLTKEDIANLYGPMD